MSGAQGGIYGRAVTQKGHVCPPGALLQTQRCPYCLFQQLRQKVVMARSKSTGKSLSHMRMKHYCLLISRNIKYPLKEKLVAEN